MAATRRMQMDVEKLMKKVQSSLEEFQATWDKMDETTDIVKRDKFEGELKKELKRLQRDRDQIRTWLACQDAKIFHDELDYTRRQIEVEMERFKQCEKASKIKAFSKEGLVLQPKLDPQEQAKSEATQFISKAFNSLQLCVDECEAEIESLVTGKSSKKVTTRIQQLEGHIQRHKWHRTKLEQVYRLLENEQIFPEDVLSLKESVDYYIDTHQDPDFVHDETLYDELPFEKLDCKVGEELSLSLSGTRTLEQLKKSGPITPEKGSSILPLKMQRGRTSKGLMKSEGSARMIEKALRVSGSVATERLTQRRLESKESNPASESDTSETRNSGDFMKEKTSLNAAKLPTIMELDSSCELDQPTSSSEMRVEVPMSAIVKSGTVQGSKRIIVGKEEKHEKDAETQSKRTELDKKEMKDKSKGQKDNPTTPKGKQSKKGQKVLLKVDEKDGPKTPRETAKTPRKTPLLEVQDESLSSRETISTSSPQSKSSAKTQESAKQEKRGESSESVFVDDVLIQSLPLPKKEPKKESEKATTTQELSVIPPEPQPGTPPLNLDLGTPRKGRESPVRPTFGTLETHFLPQIAQNFTEIPQQIIPRNASLVDQNFQSSWPVMRQDFRHSQAKLPPEMRNQFFGDRFFIGRMPQDLGGRVDSMAAVEEKNVQKFESTGNEKWDEVISLLWAGMTHVDSRLQEMADEKPKWTYISPRPCPVPEGWPQTPISPEHAPALMSKLGTDAQFFAFYFQKNTYLQLLAAKELKKKNWRFNKKTKQWFQRHSSPMEVTAEYERGNYVYFDHNLNSPDHKNHLSLDSESGWCKRLKEDFVFEYKDLEDEVI